MASSGSSPPGRCRGARLPWRRRRRRRAAALGLRAEKLDYPGTAPASPRPPASVRGARPRGGGGETRPPPPAAQEDRPRKGGADEPRTGPPAQGSSTPAARGGAGTGSPDSLRREGGRSDEGRGGAARGWATREAAARRQIHPIGKSR
jgi:hypothetical protein